jgi:hypothetical protein
MAALYGLALHIEAVPEDDDDELFKLTSRLRDELLELEVSGVAPVTEATAPDDAKGLATLTGWLLVHFGSVSALHGIFAAIRDWSAGAKREVEVTLDGDVLKVSRISAAQQEKIIDVWLARHSAGT